MRTPPHPPVDPPLEMRTVQWREKFENGSVIANTRELIDKIREICLANVPKKVNNIVVVEKYQEREKTAQ